MIINTVHAVYSITGACASLFLLGGVIFQLAFQYNYVTVRGSLRQQHCIRPAIVGHCVCIKKLPEAREIMRMRRKTQSVYGIILMISKTRTNTTNVIF